MYVCLSVCACMHGWMDGCPAKWDVQLMEKLQIRHVLDVSGFPGHYDRILYGVINHFTLGSLGQH